MDQDWFSSRWNRFQTNQLERYNSELSRRLQLPLQVHNISDSEFTRVTSDKWNSINDRWNANEIKLQMVEGAMEVWSEHNEIWQITEGYDDPYLFEPNNRQFNNHGDDWEKSTFLYEFCKKKFQQIGVQNPNTYVSEMVGLNPSSMVQSLFITSSNDIIYPTVVNGSLTHEQKLVAVKEEGKRRMREICEELQHYYDHFPGVTYVQRHEISSSDGIPEPPEVAEAEERAEMERMYNMIVNEM